MTLYAPPEQTLRAPFDRPGDPPSRRRHTGVDSPLIPALTAPEIAAP